MSKSVSHRFKSALLLLAFLFFKLGIAHELSHVISDDDSHNCEQCVMLVDSNKTNPFNGSLYTYTEDVKVTEVSLTVLQLQYKNPLFNDYRYFFYYNKPPPTHI